MKYQVQYRYSTSPDKAPNGSTSTIIESPSNRISDLQMLLQGKFPRQYNISISSVREM